MLVLDFTLGALVTLGAHADVLPKNGNFFWSQTDITDPNNPALKIERVYNSKSPYVGMLGMGWGQLWSTYIDAEGVVHDWGAGATAANVNFTVEGALRVRTTQDGTQQLFDSNGQLVQLRGSVNVEIARNSDGLIESVSDSAGHRLSFKWGPPGRVVEITGAAGTADYRYDELGLLVYVRQADGTVFRYTYDGEGRGNLTRIEYADGSTLEVDYYGRELNENVRQVRERDGRSTKYDYTWDKSDPGFSRVDVVVADRAGKTAQRDELRFASPDGGARPSWGLPKALMPRGVAPLTRSRPAPRAGGSNQPGRPAWLPSTFVIGVLAAIAIIVAIGFLSIYPRRRA